MTKNIIHCVFSRKRVDNQLHVLKIIFQDNNYFFASPFHLMQCVFFFCQPCFFALVLISQKIIRSKQKSIKNWNKDRRNYEDQEEKREHNIGEIEKNKQMWNHKAKVSKNNWILGAFLFSFSQLFCCSPQPCL